jgi:hypothetical protein
MLSIRSCSRIACLVAAGLLSALTPLLAATANVVSCPFSGAGDFLTRGFYLQSYAANNLGTVTLAYTTDTAGTFTVTLTPHSTAFNGSVVGTPQSATVSLTPGTMTPVTFNFGGAPVTPGTTLAFTQTATGGSGTVFYDAGPCDVGASCSSCPGVVETADTAPPLSTFRRGSVGVTATQEVASGTGCTASDTVLCIDNNPGDHRFELTATYATSQSGGLSGNGHAIALAPLGVSQGGLFWFFGRSNPEMLVKVLNACTVNGKFWVFFSAGTNVGFRVTVHDTVTGATKIYVNPDLNPAPPLQDTSAFSCP